MNDYKELIEELRKEPLKFARALLRFEAANAIEQLCVDVARLEAENRAKEQYIAETIGKITRERDAAIADLKINWLCAVCKKRVIKKEWMLCVNKDIYEEAFKAPTCSNFEWRGTQEAEHETD